MSTTAPASEMAEMAVAAGMADAVEVAAAVTERLAAVTGESLWTGRPPLTYQGHAATKQLSFASSGPVAQLDRAPAF